MKTSHKQIALMMGLIAIASMGSAYALMQETQPTTRIQSEGVKPLGHLQLTLYGPDGSIQAYRQTDNLVVNNGANVTANAIFGTTLTTTNGALSGAFKNIAVGTGASGPTSADTALGTQKGHKILGTVSNYAQRGSASIAGTFAAGKITNSTTQAITEAGLFDGTNLSLNSTNMFARQTFSAINVGSADSLQITWVVNIT
ncbi:MAG: hypothetical protein ACREA7_02510 [Nitrosotalea sp.]